MKRGDYRFEHRTARDGILGNQDIPPRLVANNRGALTPNRSSLRFEQNYLIGHFTGPLSQILFALRQTKRVDSEVPALLADVQVRAAEDSRERLERAADIEDVGPQPIFLVVCDQEST